MLTIENAAAKATEAIESFSDAPVVAIGSERGIVICGGGIKYGTCAWVLIRLLRSLGCQLPIEVWSLDNDEHDPQWAAIVKPYGATCVNAADILKRHPHPKLTGWTLKPYAILHSRFREVLLLDADNVPTVDPTFLFDRPEYRATGTIFWPDPPQHFTPPGSNRWQVFGVPYREEPDQESGQLIVDKSRCWKAMRLCNWYNEHAEFFYQIVYGDKDTFRFAWHRLEMPITWIPHRPARGLMFTLGQCDFDGNVLFQHRVTAKWLLYGLNRHIAGFQHEDACMRSIEELRERWQPQRHLMRKLKHADRCTMSSLVGRRFLYDRPGNNRWPIRLGEGGCIAEGYGPNEYFWWCEDERLALVGTDGKRKSILRPLNADQWESEICKLRGMSVRLIAC